MVKSAFRNPLAPLPAYARTFFQEDFNKRSYTLVALFMALTIGVNYSLDFESNYVFHQDFYQRIARYILFYGFAYFSGVAILIFTRNDCDFVKKPLFWMLSILGIVIIAADGSYRGTYDIARALYDPESFRFMGRLLFELKNFFLLFLPLLALWIVMRKPGDSFFGLTTKDVNIKPYLFILLLMFPLIAMAVEDPSFLKTYPKFRTFGVESYWEINRNWLILPFESFYGISFMNVELFFRGFLVIGLTRLMGTKSVLPMVCMYAFLHFEKPLAETIGSVFGGLLLGAFAYVSRNIWGGVVVHAGVALLMEAVAFWAKY